MTQLNIFSELNSTHRQWVEMPWKVKKLIKMKWRKTSRDRWVSRMGRYYISIVLKRHYIHEGFDEYWQSYKVLIGKDGEWLYGEGLLGSSLPYLKDAKKWAINKLKSI